METTIKPLKQMVFIKAGSFIMGSPESEEGRWDDEVQHKVTLTQKFYIGANLVTQEQWKKIMGYNPVIEYYEENLKIAEEYQERANFIGSKKPIVCVNWNDANEFCKKLTKVEQEKGNIPLDWEYRLPTEAQWEYACRAGSQEKYYNGYTDLDDIAWYAENSKRKLHEVGKKKPNAWGLYDMLGNVWEWCADWAGKYSTDSVINPTGPTTGSYRVARGGSWTIVSVPCRCAFRDNNTPGYLDYRVGFRVAICKK